MARGDDIFLLKTGPLEEGEADFLQFFEKEKRPLITSYLKFRRLRDKYLTSRHEPESAAKLPENLDDCPF